jgi:DNA-directed RNA polymerase I, II, and III subunit RPABC5
VEWYLLISIDFTFKKLEKRKLLEVNKVLYLTKEFHEKTPEGEVLDELGLKKMCCRRHLLTHVDIE